MSAADLSLAHPRTDGGSSDTSRAEALGPPFAPPAVPLAPGTCNETFDCDDTSPLPPEGHRWDCKNRKCVPKALPSLSPQPEPAEVKPVPPAAGKTKVNRSAKKKT